MTMQILATTRKVDRHGRVSGKIRVRDGKRIHTVNYERLGAHTEQWGARGEVLTFTYRTFERLVAPSGEA